jgi:hypothetical protein
MKSEIDDIVGYLLGAEEFKPFSNFWWPRRCIGSAIWCKFQVLEKQWQ